MAAPAQTTNPTQVKTGPGQIMFAPLGTTLPTLVAASSKFNNAWTGWVPIGYSDDGLTLKVSRSVDNVEVAESLETIRKVTTARNTTVTFSASGINEGNISLAFNGGTWTTVSGTGATQVRKYVPPALGSEVRIMLGFLSAEVDEAFIWYQCFQTAEATMARQKGAAKASLTGLSFDVEVPDPAVSTSPFAYWYAGTWAAPIAALA